MERKQSELAIEKVRLEQTISLAERQLEQAELDNEENRLEIKSLQQEMRDNAAHATGNLWGSEGFEALVELSQHANPIIKKVSDYETVEQKIEMLIKLIESPYFARIDFQFDGEDTAEKIYIGRRSLIDDDAFDMYVYDWRSPIASVFYRHGIGPASYDAPNGRMTGAVNLKRQYEIKAGVLNYYFDADVQIIDEFLRKLLSQNTSHKMKTIIETIQKEQDIVIRDMENDLMMVQGIAGSGKTSVALHRAAYLMYQGLSSKLSASNIMIISPNTLFEQYISNVLPELGEKAVESVVFEEILSTILKQEPVQTKNQFLEQLMTNAKYKDVMKNSLKFKTSPQFLTLLNRFVDDLPDRDIIFHDIQCGGEIIATKEVLKDRLSSGMKETPLGLKLKQVEGFVFNLAEDAARKDPGSPINFDALEQELQKVTVLDISALYKSLMTDHTYFYKLAEGLSLPDCIEDILKFTSENLNTESLYYDDAVALAYLQLKINGANGYGYQNIKQVVIDEAQDYYLLHYEILSLLFAKGKFTVLGDVNQALEKKEDISFYEMIDRTLKKKKSTLVTMDKSFRCTNEIFVFSARFLEQNNMAESYSRKGDVPKVCSAPDQETLIKNILAELDTCAGKGYQSVGLMCKTEKQTRALFSNLKGKADIQMVRHNSTAKLQGVVILPLYMSKGLEFDAVLVCDADHKTYWDEEDRNLLYVACTRALHRLNLFCAGEPSPLVFNDGEGANP